MGQRNYTTFIWFIMSITLLVFVDLVLSLLHVVREASQNGNGALSAPYPEYVSSFVFGEACYCKTASQTPTNAANVNDREGSRAYMHKRCMEIPSFYIFFGNREDTDGFVLWVCVLGFLFSVLFFVCVWPRGGERQRCIDSSILV